MLFLTKLFYRVFLIFFFFKNNYIWRARVLGYFVYFFYVSQSDKCGPRSEYWLYGMTVKVKIKYLSKDLLTSLILFFSNFLFTCRRVKNLEWKKKWRVFWMKNELVTLTFLLVEPKFFLLDIYQLSFINYFFIQKTFFQLSIK